MLPAGIKAMLTIVNVDMIEAPDVTLGSSSQHQSPLY